MAYRIGIFGGSFDPPHMGHVLTAITALTSSEVDSVIVVPTYKHPFNKVMVDFDKRVEMCEEAFSYFNKDHIDVERYAKIAYEKFNSGYTIDLLSFLKETRYPNASFRLIIGSDILSEAVNWHKWDEVIKMAPPLITRRGGDVSTMAAFSDYKDNFIGNIIPNISSTALKKALLNKDDEYLKMNIPDRVLSLIKNEHLYGF